MIRCYYPICLGIGLSLALASGVGASAAVDCGEPTPAPPWKIGDTWTTQDEQGEERTETLVGFEGWLARLEYIYPNRKTNIALFFDSDLVLRKVIKRDGTVLERPGRSEWFYIGVKLIQFPLHAGKTWSVSYELDGRKTQVGYRVLACERISVVAGEFSALKLEATHTLVGGTWQGIAHEWFAPAAKRIVRGTYQRPNFSDRARDWEILRYRVK